MSNFRLPEALPDTFHVKILKQGECWVWLGNKDKQGYGRFYFYGRQHSAHVFAYEIVKRRLGWEMLRNECENRSCCNPDHWTPVDRTLARQWGLRNVQIDAQGHATRLPRQRLAGNAPASAGAILDAPRAVSARSQITTMNLGGESTFGDMKNRYFGKLAAYSYCVPREYRLERNGIFTYDKKCLTVVYPRFGRKAYESLLVHYSYPEPDSGNVIVQVENSLRPSETVARELFCRRVSAIWISHLQASPSLVGHAQQLQRVVDYGGDNSDFITVK